MEEYIHEQRKALVSSCLRNARTNQLPEVADMCDEEIEHYAKYIATQAWHIFEENAGNVAEIMRYVYASQRGLTLDNKYSHDDITTEDLRKFMQLCRLQNPQRWLILGGYKASLQYIVNNYLHLWTNSPDKLCAAIVGYLDSDILLANTSKTPSERIDWVISSIEA